MADLRAVYDQPQTWNAKGNTRFELPSGVGRLLLIEDWVQKPVWIRFGDSTVTAPPPMSMRMDYGKAQYMVPDSATHVAIHVDEERAIIAHFGWAEQE